MTCSSFEQSGQPSPIRSRTSLQCGLYRDKRFARWPFHRNQYSWRAIHRNGRFDLPPQLEARLLIVVFVARVIRILASCLPIPHLLRELFCIAVTTSGGLVGFGVSGCRRAVARRTILTGRHNYICIWKITLGWRCKLFARKDMWFVLGGYDMQVPNFASSTCLQALKKQLRAQIFHSLTRSRLKHSLHPILFSPFWAILYIYIYIYIYAGIWGCSNVSVYALSIQSLFSRIVVSIRGTIALFRLLTMSQH